MNTRCWNCETANDPVQSPRCASCGKLQPLPHTVSPFDVLGLPETYSLGADAIESAYRKKSMQVHPDRFARAESKERRISVERTAAVNEAYRTLKHPEVRAAAMVKRAGVNLDEKSDPATLMELMEAREAADESEGAKQALLERTRGEREELMARLKSQFDDVEARSGLHDAEAMRPIAATIIRMRYLGRLFEDLMGVREHGGPSMHDRM